MKLKNSFLCEDFKVFAMKKQARPGLEGRCNRCRRQWSGQGPAEPRKALSKKKCRRKKIKDFKKRSFSFIMIKNRKLEDL